MFSDATFTSRCWPVEFTFILEDVTVDRLEIKELGSLDPHSWLDRLESP